MCSNEKTVPFFDQSAYNINQGEETETRNKYNSLQSTNVYRKINKWSQVIENN